MQSITVQSSGLSYTRFRNSVYCSSGDTGSLAIKILRCAPEVTGPLSPFQRKRQPDTEQPGVRCHASSNSGAHAGGSCSMLPEDNHRRSCPSTWDGTPCALKGWGFVKLEGTNSTTHHCTVQTSRVKTVLASHSEILGPCACKETCKTRDIVKKLYLPLPQCDKII